MVTKRSYDTVPKKHTLTVAAGATVDNEVDLQMAFSLSAGKEYKVQPEFTITEVQVGKSDADGATDLDLVSVKVLSTTILKSPTFTVKIDKNYPVSPDGESSRSEHSSSRFAEHLSRRLNSKKRAKITYAKCPPGVHQAAAKTAIASATSKIHHAKAYLGEARCRRTAAFTGWFGADNPGRTSTLKNIAKFVEDKIPNLKVDCRGDLANPICVGNWAYVLTHGGGDDDNTVNQYGRNVIHLCNIWRASANAKEKAQTIVHECTHWAGTDDIAGGVGRVGSAALAATPSQAVKNADNFGYFTVDVPATTTGC